MRKSIRRSHNAHNFSFVIMLPALLLASVDARAQCPVTVLTSGLQTPIGIAQSNQNNLLVSETGTRTSHTGTILIVDRDGNYRTLLEGLPSGINDVNEPSGPAGVFMRGRTLYVAIGIGDTIQAGPSPGTAVANPNPSSPIFSSILAIHFSAHVEKTADGLALTPADHHALASGEKVTLSNGGGDKVTVELIANFPDFTPNPLPSLPANVRGSNPFDLVVVANRLYVTDGGRNLVWQVDIPTGAFSPLATFPNISNPLFPTLGGPLVEAVPTGIRYVNGQILVTLFRGFPFPAGTSVVEQVNPLTGDHAPLITGLKTAIDVLPTTERGDTDYLVLQHASGPIFGQPGLLVGFETPGGSPTLIANCLNRPTSMVLDEKTGTLYVTELIGGRIVAIPVAP